MSIYDDMQSLASDVLGEFDQGGIFYLAMVAPVGGTPDDPGEPVATSFKLDGVARGVKMKYVDGTSILASDMQTTVAVRDDIAPDLTGFIALGSADGPRHKVVRVDPIPPVGTTVANRIFFRR